MKILAVDDKQINNKVIELDVEEYMDDKNIQNYSFYELGSGEDSLKLIEKVSLDIIFLDIMMPNMSGLELLEKIRQKKDITQPKIFMVTALNDDTMKAKAYAHGADGYICKPFDYKEIYDVLNDVIKEQEDQSDEFVDFDDGEDDSFFDFSDSEDDDSLNIQKDMMDQFNKSHGNLSAKEFLKEYEGIDYLLDDLEDIELDIYEHIETLFEDNLTSQQENIVESIDKYAHFLNTFLEFQELSTSLNLLSRIIQRSDFENVEYKKRVLIASYIKSILEDLVKWKNKIFIEQNAIDVFYLNASLLNSCIQLETVLKDL